MKITSLPGRHSQVRTLYFSCFLVATGLLTIALSIRPVSAASIGLNFNSNRDTGAALGADELAGLPVVAQRNWNNSNGGTSASDGANGTQANIISPNSGLITDSRGVVFRTTVRWTSIGTWNTVNGTSSGDAKLMNGFIDNAGAGGFATVDFDGIPYPFYDVYVYFGSDSNGRTGSVQSETAGQEFFYSTFSNDPNGGGGFNPVSDYILTSDTTGAHPNANYCVFQSQTSSAFSLRINRGSDNSGIHGVQIVGVDNPGRARVENNAATDITTNSATLGGTVTDIGDAAPVVTIYYGDNNGGIVAGNWDQSILLPGNQSGAFSANVTGLNPATTYYFRALAVNAAGSSWAPTTATFQSAAFPPSIVNLPATDIQTTSAEIGLDVTSTGGETPIVTLYWGQVDGGTVAGNWSRSTLLGAVSGVVRTRIEGLDPGRTYFYRALAMNSGGSVWASSTASFTSKQPVPPSVENRPANGVSGTAANLRGSVTDIGFDPPVVMIYHGTSDGGTDPISWDQSINLGVRTGDFSYFLSGLDPLTTYYFRALALNGAGSSWAPSTESFTTTDLVSSAIVINEIHYDHEPKTERGEFIELYNAGDLPVELTGWRLEGAVDYEFPPGTMIDANGFLVVAEDPPTLQSVFGVSSLGPFTGKLSNDGERTDLEDQNGDTVDEVDYGIGFPWPTASRGAGASMELINETLDNDLGSSWRAAQSGFSGPQVTYIGPGESWRYRKGTSEASSPIDAWRFASFTEDATWLTGTTVIGYGDGDDTTVLSDMRNGYASVYLRKQFTVTGEIPSQLLLRVYHDDAAIIWINGIEVGRISVALGDINFEANRASDPPGGAPGGAVTNHEASWTDLIILGAQGVLLPGLNTMAIHGLNGTFGSSDFSIDCELKTPDPSSAAVGVPSPGAANSAFAPNAPPNIRQVDHQPNQPVSGQDVIITAKVTDPEGVASVMLSYQLVEPGAYIRKTDANYETDWTFLPMFDDGAGNDLASGDSIFTVTMPGSFQVHRRLIRYRITVEDSLGAAVRTPFADDESPNFAYFCYDGVPAWTGSKRPGSAPNITYPAEALNSTAVYHLISRESDVILCQWSGPNDGQYRYLGTWVYDGKVYDHMRYRIRGNASTYQVGRNKWKINFNRARPLEARDNYGRKYKVGWDKINVLPGSNPWWRNNASTDGTIFCESLGFRLYEMAGGVGSHTQFFQFRVIDSAQEAPAGDQYGGDFWGLYIAIEQPEAEFLNERGLPDGNIYNVHGGSGSSKRNQGATQNSDYSDLFAFQGLHGSGTSQAQWEANLDFDDYFAFNAMNLAINNSDMRPQENINYYHNSDTGKWHILPWDIDLTFEDAPHLGRGDTPAWERIYHCLQYPAINQAYENRVRHILDLLLDSDQSAHLVDEYAGFVTVGGSVSNIVEASQAVWDYHPRKNKKGIWYANFNTSLLPSRTFASLKQYTKNFLTVGGYGRNNLASKQTDSAIPNKPLITYVGPAGFPTDNLTFRSSPFSDPQGSGTFGSMQWRIGEIHNPTVAGYVPGDRYVYEIETFYQTEPMPMFQSQFKFPPVQARVGATYRARVRYIDNTGRASHWSDPVQFSPSPPDVTPWINNLMISELMYHPADATTAEIAAGFEDSDFEYIELKNISSTQTLDLKDLRFTKGIDFDFANGAITSLAPGAYVLVVRNQVAFESRHLPGLLIAGQYWPDNLQNEGENVKLSFGAGSAIHEFEYDDMPNWPTAPDGLGFSLTLISPESRPLHSNPFNWRSSVAVGGSPGTSDAVPFSGDPNADVDQDGLNAVEEYFFGRDDSVPDNDSPLQAGLTVVGADTFLTLTFTSALAADNVFSQIDISNDLITWRPGGEDEIALVSSRNNGDGTATYVIRSRTPIMANTQQFLRQTLLLR